MSEVAIGLQVRLDSRRLPRKALLPLAGKPVIVHAMEALAATGYRRRYILTDEESSELLGDLGRAQGFSLLTGDPEDVLSRYADLARRTGAGIIVRATGDNPAVSGRMCAAAVEMMESSGADLTAFDGLPLGTGVEVVAARAILEADREAKASDEREHVTLHLYRNRNHYVIDRREAPQEALFPEGRVTLDTEEDYALLSELYQRAYTGAPLEVERVITELTRLSVEGNRTPCRS